MPDIWRYIALFEQGKSDQEVAEELGVRVETVREKREVQVIYALATVHDPARKMAEDGRHLKTIYRELRDDIRWAPFADMLLLRAIIKGVSNGNPAPPSPRQIEDAVREALPPSVRGFAAQRVVERFLRDFSPSPGP